MGLTMRCTTTESRDHTMHVACTRTGHGWYLLLQALQSLRGGLLVSAILLFQLHPLRLQLQLSYLCTRHMH